MKIIEHVKKTSKSVDEINQACTLLLENTRTKRYRNILKGLNPNLSTL